MNILSTLRRLKSQVEHLEANQKEPVHIAASSGCAFSAPPASQTIGLLMHEIEGLYEKLIDAQSRALNNDNYS